MYRLKRMFVILHKLNIIVMKKSIHPKYEKIAERALSVIKFMKKFIKILENHYSDFPKRTVFNSVVFFNVWNPFAELSHLLTDLYFFYYEDFSIDLMYIHFRWILCMRWEVICWIFMVLKMSRQNFYTNLIRYFINVFANH